MAASSTSRAASAFSDPTRLWGLGVFVATVAFVFVPSMVAPWRAGVLTPQLMGDLLRRGIHSHLALYVLPLALGALVLIMRSGGLARACDSFGVVLDGWRDIQGTGKLKRFLVKPFVWLSATLWDGTHGIGQPDWRTALRLTVQAYIVGFFLFVAFTALIVLLVVVAIGLALLLVSFFMGGSGGGETVVTRGPRIAQSRRTRDWSGERTDHFDEGGRKVAESRIESDFVGEKVTHRDASGEVIGESREATDWIGKKTVHFAASGEEAGESRTETDFVGEKVAHFDSSGARVGESREHSDFTGGHVEHEGSSPADLRMKREGERDDGDGRPGER